ncbi:MAG: DUF4125 family protein [Lachnospiraceae bacterium]|nr:DUF4125 family protein [Lachnospiraceae bacterium]
MRSVEEILYGLDKLFEEQRMDKVEVYLQDALKEAMDEKEDAIVITIVNEIIGFYRDISMYEKSIYYCEQILPFMEMRGLKDSIHYATTCLNVANAYRAAGKWEISLSYYDEVKKVYDQLLAPTDSLYASYYNNLSLLHQEMGDFEQATKCLKKALEIIEIYQDEIKIAITCSNLAASLLRIDRQNEAEEYLNRSLKIFIEDGERDFHYGAALSVMGELQFQKENYIASLKYYKRALSELEKHVGKTEYYYRTLDNFEKVKSKIPDYDAAFLDDSFSRDNIDATFLKKKSLGKQMCEDYFYEYGEPMLLEKFPEYIDKIAIGKVGEGSDCWGFDDEVSRDHDFGPGFCMWVTRETYGKIGEKLQKEYEKLPSTFRGISGKYMKTGKGRVGVCIIEEFYERILGVTYLPQSIEEWNKIEESMLACATNGWVLKDNEGIFTGIRKQLLDYYPDEVWKAKIAQCMYHISQYGQYNYGRMAKRNDIITAEQCRSGFVKSVMQLLYLLNRTYAPYYKWMYQGLEYLKGFTDDLEILKNLKELVLTPIMAIENNELLMELISVSMLELMVSMGLVKEKLPTNYMEHYIGQVLQYDECNVENSQEIEHMGELKEDMSKESLVEMLVNLEWQNFDKVENEGGRADCQDDWNTFSIMRKSQYLTWNIEMLVSYIRDFENAMEKGWNLITEKYGRMMESTAPEHYEEIKSQFPILPDEKKKIIEEIVKIQVVWMEEFALKYPYMAGNSRVIHTREDSTFSTSFETYLRGELGTYSDKTLDLYGRFIVSYLQDGKNLTEDIMMNTALLYGYESLQKAEELLEGQ